MKLQEIDLEVQGVAGVWGCIADGVRMQRSSVDQGGCMRICKWTTCCKRRQAGEEWTGGADIPQWLVTFPASFSIDFLGKTAGKFADGDHVIAGTATSCVNQLPSTRLWSHDHVGARRAGIPRTTCNHHLFSTVIILNSCWTNGDWLKTICIDNRISEQLCMNLFVYCSYITVCWWQNLQVKGTTKFSLLAIKDRQVCIYQKI